MIESSNVEALVVRPGDKLLFVVNGMPATEHSVEQMKSLEQSFKDRWPDVDVVVVAAGDKVEVEATNLKGRYFVDGQEYTPTWPEVETKERPRRARTCGEVHPGQDVHHPGGHPVEEDSREEWKTT